MDSFHVSVPGQTPSEHSNTDVVDREIQNMPAGLGWEDVFVLLKAKGLSIGRAELRRMVLGPKSRRPPRDRGMSPAAVKRRT